MNMNTRQLPKLVIDDAIPFLENRLENLFDSTYLPGEKICKSDLEGAKGLLVRTRTKCNAALLDGTDIEFIATGTIGLDHIDGIYCTSRGIDWQNSPGCNAPAVAQYVWRALFQLGFGKTGVPGKIPTLGVVGKGNVGSIIVEWGRRMGFNVIVCDPPRKDKGFEDEDYISLEELMKSSDAVTFHTPLTPKSDEVEYPTRYLGNYETLSLLKPGAILINAARGGIVDEKALLKVKSEKNLKICIDTWEGEADINPETLEAADIATFHIAGYSLEGKERATRMILEGLERHFGVEIDKSNLCGNYHPLENISREAIEKSYDIMADDALLREAPQQFETNRNGYHLRREVGDA